MFNLHDEPLFGMILYEAVSNAALGTFIWPPGRNMTKKVFKVSKPATFGWDKNLGVSRKLTYLISSQVDIL